MALDVRADRVGPAVPDGARRALRARYLPIAEHGLIGGLHTVALVGTHGTIEWYCSRGLTRRASSGRSSTPSAAACSNVVPFEARSKYVGADYVEQLATLRGGTFRRNPPDVGILASLDSLDGPTFNAALVHPLIREFYEHTSRFGLSIAPSGGAGCSPAT
jgi:hypothetical protein